MTDRPAFDKKAAEYTKMVSTVMGELTAVRRVGVDCRPRLAPQTVCGRRAGCG